jgi:hypothetical protein
MADDIAMDEDEDEPVPRNGLLLPRIGTSPHSFMRALFSLLMLTQTLVRAAWS